MTYFSPRRASKSVRPSYCTIGEVFRRRYSRFPRSGPSELECFRTGRRKVKPGKICRGRNSFERYGSGKRFAVRPSLEKLFSYSAGKAAWDRLVAEAIMGTPIDKWRWQAS